MNSKESKYAETGVDAHKRGIEVFKSTVDNLFPEAFCVIQEDPDFPEYYMITHSDGAGSKPVQNYLHYRETGDATVFRHIAQDAFMMNMGDIECVGAYPISFVDYVAINGLHVPKELFLRELNEGFRETFSMLKKFGRPVPFAGGETADLPDQLRTVDVSGTMVARVKRTDVITGGEINPGDVIIGLRSGGRTKYEDSPNSGIMCNGITLARHCLMSPEYEERYPEIREPAGKEYYGKFRTDEYHPDLGMTVGEALISPTRVFSPVIRKILRNSPGTHGITLNSGGGQTKLLRLGKNVRYVKDNLPDPDPIFYLIQESSGEEWEAMHEDYNMGIGMDILCDPAVEGTIACIAAEYGLGCQRTGYVEGLDSAGPNELLIKSRFGEFRYVKNETQ